MKLLTLKYKCMEIETKVLKIRFNYMDEEGETDRLSYRNFPFKPDMMQELTDEFDAAMCRVIAKHHEKNLLMNKEGI